MMRATTGRDGIHKLPSAAASQTTRERLFASTAQPATPLDLDDPLESLCLETAFLLQER